MRRNDLAAVDPTPTAQAAFVKAVDCKMQCTVWRAGECRGFYFDSSGRNFFIWPGLIGAFRRRVRRFRSSEYAQIPRGTTGSQTQNAPENTGALRD
jgi:hypothetical protein